MSRPFPETGGTAELTKYFSEPYLRTTPVGIQPCLGSQLTAALEYTELVTGLASTFTHTGTQLFKDTGSPFLGARFWL